MSARGAPSASSQRAVLVVEQRGRACCSGQTGALLRVRQWHSSRAQHRFRAINNTRLQRAFHTLLLLLLLLRVRHSRMLCSEPGTGYAETARRHRASLFPPRVKCRPSRPGSGACLGRCRRSAWGTCTRFGCATCGPRCPAVLRPGTLGRRGSPCKPAGTRFRQTRARRLARRCSSVW
jgi:hypothetical protein